MMMTMTIMMNGVQGADQRDDYHDIMDRLQQLYEHLEELDAATAEARASGILAGLGFTKAMQAKKTREFSGGWRMRIALARALFISVGSNNNDDGRCFCMVELVIRIGGRMRESRS